ncbi:hypothetical protein ACEPAI_8988 [Sanghuangporus weigelae]
MAIESQQKVASVGSSIRQLFPKAQNELLVKEEAQLESQVALSSSSLSLQIQRPSQLGKGSEKGKNKEIIAEGTASSSTNSSPSKRSSRSSPTPRGSRAGSKRARSPAASASASASGSASASSTALDARVIEDGAASHVQPKKKRRRVVPYVLVPALEQVDAARPARRVRRGNGDSNVNGSQDRNRSEYERVKSGTPDELLLGEGEDELAVGIGVDADVDADADAEGEGESELEEHDAEPDPDPDSESESESEVEVEDSGAAKGPVQHVFVQAPPIHTAPLYLSRERSILRRALLVSTERARLGIGRYDPPSHWEDFTPRAYVDVIKRRGAHAARNESRAERYVRILEDAYGKGDWWRGEGRKPPLVVGGGPAGRSQAQAKETIVIESSSEDESEAESEDAIEEFTQLADTHVQTRENELSDSSADPPAPITPPDEVPLLRDSITVANSTIAKAAAGAGNADALNAPIVVYDNDNDNENDIGRNIDDLRAGPDIVPPPSVSVSIPELTAEASVPAPTQFVAAPLATVDPRSSR